MAMHSVLQAMCVHVCLMALPMSQHSYSHHLQHAVGGVDQMSSLKALDVCIEYVGLTALSKQGW
jgi:hypothetical protein